jgi:hypothetical protein
MPLITTSDNAKATTIKLRRIFFLSFVVIEKIVVHIAAVTPTRSVVPSPPINDKNNTTKIAPAEAPMRSEAYSRPAVCEKALNAAEITTPTKKNGIANMNIKRGRYVTWEASECITNNVIGKIIQIPIEETMVRSAAQFSLILFNL